MSDTILLAIIPVLSAALTAFVSWRLARLKTNIDVHAVGINESDAIRDDLLQLIGRYEEREKRLTDLIERLQIRITELLDQVDHLRGENRRLESEIRQMRDELAKFERKVFYTPQNKTQEKPTGEL